ncbi:GAF domain-containing sensor histidine kinase [Pontibacter sp. CAU 1760]
MQLLDIATTGKPDSIIPTNDAKRLAALFRYEILDTPPEAFFDRITRLAAKLLKAPSAFISLVDKERVWYKSNFSPLQVPSVERNDSLCSLTIINDIEVTVFEDTHQVNGLQESPYVSSPNGIRFYAGAPLITHDHFNIGTICVIDSKPRSATEEEKETLRDLAMLVVEQIEFRAMARKATRRHNELYNNLESNIIGPMQDQQTLLSAAYDAEDKSELIRQAQAKTNVLQESLHKLLEESIEEDELVPHPQKVAISAIARKIAEEYEPLAKTKKQEFYFTVASRREFLVDPNLIREALSSLVSMAIKFAPSGSAIGLDIFENDGEYRIEISSETSVLTTQDLQKIFLKYAILSGKATGNETVSGLELAKAKRIIELHQGKLWAEQLGKDNGKKFVITFNTAG